MQINIRKARQDDYDALCVLFDEIDALHRNHLPHLFQKGDGAAREKDYYEALLAEENISLFVAEADQTLVGLIHAEIIETPVFPIIVPRRYTKVDNLVVKAGYQNQGIGKRLMDVVQDWAIANEATSLELTVYEFNKTAIAFYEKAGFQSVSRKMSKKI
ncbi:MAG: hypothetical protein CL609_03705 [Anaerolineaceae bacterium]|nr:hypothetical protein [Anaerolineaceae bacterium]